MPAVHTAARELADEGGVELCQRGKAVEGRVLEGPYRIRLRGMTPRPQGAADEVSGEEGRRKRSREKIN